MKAPHLKIGPRWFSWRFVLVLVAGASVLSFNFGSRLLLTNDDTRFPVLARDVLLNGHWLVPALPDGTPHIMKPPLVVWLIALASWPTQAVSVRTAVLPSLLAAIGVVLLTYWLGRRLFDADTGVVAALIVATTLGLYQMAHSSMPDMVQLVAGMGAIAVYVAFGFESGRAWLVPFYAVLGLGSLAKGAAGLIPLAIVLVHAVVTFGPGGLRRLVSIPGCLVLVALAVPWWLAAAAVEGRQQFVEDFVFNEQLRYYFTREFRNWRILVRPVILAVTVLFPWAVLLPFAIRRAFRETDPAASRGVRLLLVWLSVAFLILAISGQQRQRYYLPLCPAGALLVAWWHSTLRWRGRMWAFATAWSAVVAMGAVAVWVATSRLNATTDLRAFRAVLAEAPAPVFAIDLQDLVLSFNLDHPVVSAKTVRTFEDRVRAGERAYLVISERAIGQRGVDGCLRPVARGRVTRRHFVVLEPVDCDKTGSPAGITRSG